MFVVGQTYIRRELHSLYGGQRQAGISTPANRPFIFLFTGEQGEQYGYQDGWTGDGLFLYTGEGQVGDMTFVSGNRAIRDHAKNGKDLHLFEYVQTGRVRYIGQMVCTGFQERQAPDREGRLRKVIVFELTPVSAFPSDDLSTEPIEESLWGESLATLRERALATPSQGRNPTERKALVRYRSVVVRTYVIKRAEDRCEGCASPAPFLTSAGRPYLEPHHIRRLSDGGPDHPEWVAALCPNCHRRAHYAVDKTDFTNQIVAAVQEKEARLRAEALPPSRG